VTPDRGLTRVKNVQLHMTVVSIIVWKRRREVRPVRGNDICTDMGAYLKTYTIVNLRNEQLPIYRKRAVRSLEMSALYSQMRE
jgi:hypothetical protein